MIIGIDGNEANIQNRVGVNEYALQILIALEKLPESKKHQFIIYLKNDPLPEMPQEREGWKYKILPGRGLWNLRILTPHLLLTRQKLDVFFSPSHYAPPILKIPLVISIMDLGYLSSVEQFKKSDFYQLKYWGALSMFKAKKILAISQSTKEEIIKHYNKLKDKIEVTLLSVDKNKFNLNIKSSEINEVKKYYKIENPYILFLSTLKPNKNVEGILEAFTLLKDKQKLNLVIAGKKGWLYETIFNKVTFLGLEDRVIFTDFISDDKKPALVAGAEVFVAPSFWEGFGINVLEAMSCGVPVVVSKAGSLPEVVGNAGIYVDPKNPASIALGLEKVLKARQKYSKLAFDQSKLFDWEKTAKSTLDVIEKARN